MTAIVGILNRQAVAIAADSAVTVNGKSTNRALKMFTLSKYQPIGVMIYSNASFMGVPWETIIKMYRKNLQEGSRKTVKEYQEDFVKYLRDQGFFLDDTLKINWIRNTYRSVINNIYNELIKRDEQNWTPFINNMLAETDGYTEVCPDFENMTIEEFRATPPNLLEELFDALFTQRGMNIGNENMGKISEFLFRLIKYKSDYWSFTGLVFVGFGDDEIFPSLVPINVSFGVVDKLKYFVETGRIVKISNEWRSSIQPFAQTETMTTILTGISPKLEQTYIENFKLFLDKYNTQLIASFGAENAQLIEGINNINTSILRDEYGVKVREASHADYVSPLLGAVETLSKEDLAEMAESLIYMTFLQKRITSEPEDVGGHVDVAVISKGDGFIWIKRKHYFEQELNRHFMSNYFRK